MTSPESRVKLWSRDYVLAIVTNFFVATVFYLIITSAALHAFNRFAASESGAGTAAGALVVGALIARIPSGKYLDFIGRRRLLIASFILGAVCSVLYLFADSLVLLVAIRVLHGISIGAGSTAVTAGALSIIPTSRRGEGAGFYGISTTMGSALGPVLGVVAVNSGGYEALFFVSAAGALAGMAAALLLKMPEREPTEAEVRAKWVLKPSSLVDLASLPISSVMFVAGFAFAGVLGFLTPYAESEGQLESGPAFFAILATTVLASRFFVGRAQDAFGDNAVVYPLLTCLSGGLLLLSISPGGVPLIVAAILIGFGYGSLMPTVQAIAVEVSEPHRVGLVTSTFFLMLDLGIGVGPIVDGALLPILGYRGMFQTLAVVALLATVLYYFVHGRRRSSSVLRRG